MRARGFGLRQRGFSLVELMVAMGLSLVLLGGALSILYSSKVTYSENDRIARLQEAGRTAVELILRDARAAGFVGCSRPINAGSFVNTLATPTGLLWNFAQPLYGFNATGSAFQPALAGADLAAIPNAITNSDILVLRTTREGQPTFRLNAALIDPTLALSVDRPSNATLPANTTLVVGDCRGATAFLASSLAAGGTPTTATINHAASLVRTFEIDARVTTVDTVIYYVRQSDTGFGPALYRKVGNDPERPLVEGVENIQVAYGIDTNGDMLADGYFRADQVDAANNWGNVVSLTIAVLVRSETETNLDTDQRSYQLLPSAIGQLIPAPGDRRQRSVFTTTVTLRNRTN